MTHWLRQLWLVTAILVVLHLARLTVLQFGGGNRGRFFLDLLNLDQEAACGTWFASVLLLLAAATCFAAGSFSPNAFERRSWLFISFLFLVLSVDEVTGVHERVGAMMRNNFDLPDWLYFGWTIPATALVIALTAVFARFVWTRLPATRRGLVLSAAVYLGGALGAETLGSVLMRQGGWESWSYGVMTAVEEGMEMSGVILMIQTTGREALRLFQPSEEVAARLR